MNLTSIRSIRPMTPIKNVSLNREVLIQRWQRQLIGRTDISFHEFLHLLRQHVWLNSQITFLLFFFLIFTKHDLLFYFFILSYCWRRSFACSIVIQAGYSLKLNGLDLYTKWPSMCTWYPHLFCLNKHLIIYLNIYIYRISNRTKDVRSLEPFIRAFRHISDGYDSISIDDFCIIFEDSSVWSSLMYKT